MAAQVKGILKLAQTIVLELMQIREENQ